MKALEDKVSKNEGGRAEEEKLDRQKCRNGRIIFNQILFIVLKINAGERTTQDVPPLTYSSKIKQYL